MRIPAHIGIIPDGNRRWATNSGLEKHQGYNFGLKPGVELLKLAKAIGIKEISYYGFTTDNWKRPTAQCQAFVQACVNAVKLIAEQPVSLLVVGNTESEAFPQELKDYTTRTNLNGGGIKVNFLVNYGWDWDISAIDPQRKEKSQLLASLHSKDISRIDLVIRWGGMRRLSGFLPVQCAYADFYVLDSLWPEFKPGDFTQALHWYDQQDVTLGG